jgi:hypothetical protein
MFYRITPTQPRVQLIIPHMIEIDFDGCRGIDLLMSRRLSKLEALVAVRQLAEAMGAEVQALSGQRSGGGVESLLCGQRWGGGCWGGCR